MKRLLSLSRSLSRDPDKRILWWLLKHANLHHDHRVQLVAIKRRLKEPERALVRTLFSLYRPVGVPGIR